jgi:serine/threonine protein kinase
MSSDPTHAMPHAELVPGVIVGPWLIRARHNKGSFGLVFRVERAGHPEAGSFALKVALHRDDPRFPKEVALLQSTVHPSVPRFEDRGWWKNAQGRDYPYVVMEWVDGLPLYAWAKVHRPTSAQVLQVLAQLAGALAAAHATGGVHRDVKGDNILVTSEGRAVLLDWGCGTHEGAKNITDTCLPPGTSSYRAPEALRWAWAHQKTGEPYTAGPADDVYALGAAAYRLCTGIYPPAPDEGSGPQRRLVPPRELATVSRGLERLLLACLSQDRRARPPAAALAIGLSAAAGEPDAGAPILPTPVAEDTDPASHPSLQPRWVWPGWASTAMASLGGGLMAGALLLLFLRSSSELGHRPEMSVESTPLAEQIRETPAPEAPDGGVGEEALTSVVQAPRDAAPYTTVGLPMPKEPAPGQKKPPCDPDVEVSVLGACWSLLKKESPCGAAAFDYQGKCLRAVYEGPRQPTSEEPR